MPNWCEGMLKVRGTKENIKAFCENELLGDGEKKETTIEFDEYDFTLYNPSSYLYIQGTRRHFIEVEDKYVGAMCNNDDIYLIMLPFKAAWCIEAEQLRDLSEKYHIDFRIKGYECGVGFTQEIEILDGEITLNEEQNYDDYAWECEQPELGG